MRTAENSSKRPYENYRTQHENPKMIGLIKSLKGDRAIWGLVALLALFSFLPVYSSTTKLALMGNKTSFEFLMKHGLLLVLGFGIIYAVHRVPTRYFKGLSIMALPFSIALLVLPLAIGATSEGESASRWIVMPVVSLRFQPSTLASLVLMVWVARFLAKTKDETISFKDSLLPLWFPVLVTVGLILPENFSTAAILMTLVLLLCFLGGYPLKYLGAICGTGLLVLSLFVYTLRITPKDDLPGRAKTWQTRINTFWNPEEATQDAQRQANFAKIAIANGGLVGKGAGKSETKNHLPQSSSDFIYAIIIEEYGFLGGGLLLFIYMLLLFRIVVVANSAKTIFSKLLVLGVGLPIVFQALINMAVVVQLFPVTGQPLPLISMGGTSIWMTCLAIGIILSASDKSEVVPTPTEKSEHNPLEVLSGQL